MEKNTNIKNRLRNDLLLIAFMIVAAVGLIVYYRVSSSNGSYAVVIIDGVESGSYILTEDSRSEVKTKYGTNVIVVESGKVSVTEADCPDLVCVKHREISASGESIVCLPHRLVIEIRE